jgi:hypothetical protein
LKEGAMPEDPTKTDPDPKVDPKADPAKTDPDPKVDDQLGPAGEKALAEERAARRAAEKASKEAKAELEKLRKESMTDQEKAIAEARAEARKEALGTANERLMRAEIKAAAGNKLADPGDAVAHLRDAGDLDRFLSDDGEIDTKAVTSAIDELLKTKPYLAATAKTGALPGGGAKPSSNGFSMDDWLRDQAHAKRG